MGEWADENNRPLICELENGDVTTTNSAILVRKRSPFFQFINDVIGRIVEGGVFVHIVERGIDKEKLESKFDSPTFADTYSAISITNLQTAFCLLTFILRAFNSAFRFTVLNFPLNRCACLTVSVYIL